LVISGQVEVRNPKDNFLVTTLKKGDVFGTS